MRYLAQLEFQENEQSTCWLPILLDEDSLETAEKKVKEIHDVIANNFGKVNSFSVDEYQENVVVGLIKEYIRKEKQGSFYKLTNKFTLESLKTKSITFSPDFVFKGSVEKTIPAPNIEDNTIFVRELSDNIPTFGEYLVVKLKHTFGAIKMEPKKNPTADLEKLRGVLSLGGLVLSLFVVYSVINWKFYDVQASELGELIVDEEEEEIIPITEQNTPPPPPPPPPAAPEIIEIVEDDIEVEDIEIEDTEADAETVVEVFEEEEEVEEEEVFTIVESMPQFPGGGQAALFKYLGKNIKYPQIAKENGIQGTVFVNFVVGKDGSIRDVKILRGVNKMLDKEAVRVVESFPKWIPGKQRGKPVSVTYNLPIKFTLK